MSEPIGELDFRPGEMDDDEAEALLDHTLAVLNRARAQLGLEPLRWAEAEQPAFDRRGVSHG
jgi:hypothetical protein